MSLHHSKHLINLCCIVYRIDLLLLCSSISAHLLFSLCSSIGTHFLFSLCCSDCLVNNYLFSLAVFLSEFLVGGDISGLCYLGILDWHLFSNNFFFARLQGGGGFTQGWHCHPEEMPESNPILIRSTFKYHWHCM